MIFIAASQTTDVKSQPKQHAARRKPRATSYSTATTRPGPATVVNVRGECFTAENDPFGQQPPLENRTQSMRLPCGFHAAMADSAAGAHDSLSNRSWRRYYSEAVICLNVVARLHDGPSQNTSPSPAMKLILASASPRRRELLAAAGYRFEVLPASDAAECGVCSGESPAEMVARLAASKAADVVERLRAKGRGDLLVLACDTVAECDGRILGKPAGEDHARGMLHALRGRTHRVFTGVCLWATDRAEPAVRVDETTLTMDALSDDEIEDYLASGHWEGKAGAFGLQDRLGWVRMTRGSESNVVGLPMELLETMLADEKRSREHEQP